MVDNIEEIEKEVLKNISKAESFDELQKIKIDHRYNAFIKMRRKVKIF